MYIKVYHVMIKSTYMYVMTNSQINTSTSTHLCTDVFGKNTSDLPFWIFSSKRYRISNCSHPVVCYQFHDCKALFFCPTSPACLVFGNHCAALLLCVSLFHILNVSEITQHSSFLVAFPLGIILLIHQGKNQTGIDLWGTLARSHI